jgi:hypothetical protein
MMERLLAKVREFNDDRRNENQPRLQAKADVTLRETKVEIRTNQERMEVKTEANKGKSEALRATLLSQMDIHQARTEVIQEEMETKMN